MFENKYIFTIFVIFIFGLATQPAAASSGSLFRTRCAPCHGSRGQGKSAVAKYLEVKPSALKLPGRKSAKKLAAAIAEGRGRMPGYKGRMSEREISKMAAYLRGLGRRGAAPAAPAQKPTAPTASGGGSSANLERGASLYKSKCGSCHGKSGEGSAMMAKVFKATPEALNLADAATAARPDAELISTTKNGKNKMPAYKGKLSDEEIGDLIGFIRSLKK